MPPRPHVRPARRPLAAAAVLAMVVLLLAPTLGVGAQPDPAPAQPGRVIVVLIDGVSYEELAEANLPGFERLADAGSVGLMTVPLGVQPRNASAYATIGSGYPVPPAAAPLEHASGYNADERVDRASAASVYRRTTGDSPGEARVLVPDIAALERAFDGENVNGTPGALGSALHAAGLRTALVGNADGGADGIHDRAAALVAMDASGTVDFGAVGSGLYRGDDAFPFGVRTDYERLLTETERALEHADLVVVETGDARRARAEATAATQRAARLSRVRALEAAAGFIGELLPLVDERTLLLVVSASAPDDVAEQGKALAPVFAAGGEFPAGGTLHSPTTRHEGILAPHDIAPTVLAHIGVRPVSPMVGLPVVGRSASDPNALLLSTLGRAGELHRERSAVLAVFIVYQILLLLWIAVPEVQAWLATDTRRWALPYTLATLGVAMLVEPLLGPQPLPIALVAIALPAAVLAVALAWPRRPLPALLALSFSTTALIAADVVFGAPLGRWSFLGYDLVTGGRFYGIGNEFAGVLLGASIVAAALAVSVFGSRKPLALAGTAVAFLGLILLFASPSLGADAGGALSAAAGYGVAFYGFAGGRFTWRRLALLGAVLLGVAVAGLFVANVVLATSDGSHVGRFLVRIAAGDFGFVTSTVLRKLGANAHLLAVSTWSRLLVVALSLCGWLAFRYRSNLVAVRRREPALWYGLGGLLAGGIAALALNDSGVVALATMSPFAVLLLLTLVLAPATDAEERS